MTQIQWAAQRGRPSTPIIPRSRFPQAKPKGPTPPPPPPIAVDVVRREPDNITVSAFAITRETATKHNVTIPQMMGDGRTKPVVLARQEAWWRIWRELGYSYPRIAKAFGKDHSTIIHGVRRHAERLAVDATGESA